MRSYLVSIITVVYNGEKYIKDTLESVINQTYGDIEYIIIDGGSTDGTMRIVNEYKSAISVIISEPDQGIYDAMNKGIKLSNGDIVGIINADDFYEKNAIELVVQAFKIGDCDVVYGDKVMLDEKTKVINIVSVPLPKKISDVNISKVHPTVFVKKNVYCDFLFNSKYKLVADRDLFYRLFISGYKFIKLDVVIATMRDGGVSSTWFKPLCEVYAVHKKYLGVLFALYVSIRYTGGYLKKRLFANFHI
jgi:glycosyltransferase involved in cell wall biosynthesis